MGVSNELKAEEPGWRELSDGTPVLAVKNAFAFQDISTCYDPHEFPCRTTLVKLESGECTVLDRQKDVRAHQKALFPHEIQELYGQQILVKMVSTRNLEDLLLNHFLEKLSLFLKRCRPMNLKQNGVS